MAKKKINTDAQDALDLVAEETVQTEQPSADISEETAEIEEIPPVVNTAPKMEPPPMRPLPSAPAPTPAAPVKKKRIRIRKKGAKKLSAAIICQNPNIVRFI